MAFGGNGYYAVAEPAPQARRPDDAPMPDRHILFRNDFTGETLFFAEPRKIVTAWSVDEVEAAFATLERAKRDGFWSAGFIAYEAGHALDPALAGRLRPRRARGGSPLLSFGIFDGPQPPAAAFDLLTAEDPGPGLTSAVPRWDFATYSGRFATLHEQLQAGECYQANLTFEMTATHDGNAPGLFNRLRARQAVAHAALVALDGPAIVSRSPELFFRVGRDGFIESKPMKGTAPRGTTAQEDRAFRQWLENDPKCRSENLMIVDLLRNDLSRVCEAGSVHVPDLYRVESFATVHQMVSRVRGKLAAEMAVIDIMRALFPCGSITGAPKIRAMEILHELEDTDRGVYCGSIGWISPGGPMEFNVAIRTISLFAEGKAVFNVGGGIVFDSDAAAEYDECLVKALYAAPTTETAQPRAATR